MNLEGYNVLNTIVREFRYELTELENEIQYNLRCMKETDVFVRSLLDSQSVDFKIFSPRNVEYTHKDEIEKSSDIKQRCEQRNKELTARRDVLMEHVRQLESILEQKDHNDLILMNIQEEDRQRIARDLHDTSLQNLAHLTHKIELSSLYIDQDPVKAKLELSLVNKILRETIEEIRNTIYDLRSMTFDDLGLKTAFERLLDNLNDSGKYTIKSEIDNVSCENEFVLVFIYRVVQECLNNINKHAEAREICFICRNETDRCVIEISDDGKGFDKDVSVSGKHFGLSLMKERIGLLNGKIDISSQIGIGTKVHVEVPLKF